MEASQATAAPMIPTDPREKYTYLGERPKVYPRPSSGRGRQQVPDVTATLAFGDPNKTLSQPPADLGPLRHVAAPAGMKNEFGQEIHNEAELARQQLAASGIAGLPTVDKDKILPDESSPSKGQKLGSLNAVEKEQQSAEEIEARKRIILASYHSAVTFLETNGVKHLMTRLFRGPIVVAQQKTVQELLQNVCLFDYSNGKIVDATYPTSSTKILIAPNTVPAHIWFLVSLLTGTYPTTTAFESVIRKWKEIVEYVTTKSVDDPVVASDLLFDPVQDHALNAKNKYGDLILLNPRVYLDDLRLKCIENWMQELMLRVRKHMQNAVLISDAKANMMLRANEVFVALTDQEDESSNRA